MFSKYVLRRQPTKSRRSRRALLEHLEDRSLLAATITVNSTLDLEVRDDALTLREAIQISNRTLDPAALTPAEQAQVSQIPIGAEPATIGFNIPGVGVRRIQIDRILPAFSRPVIVDGYTQPGSRPNNDPNGFNGALLVELTGTATPTSGGYNGLTVSGGDSTIRGLIINRFGASAIRLLNSSNNLVEGNILGIDPVNGVTAGNGDGVGINALANPGVQIRDNRVGGPSPAARNIISGNGSAISLGANIGSSVVDSVVQGNFLGTDLSGTAAVPNWNGINVGFFVNNLTVGGSNAGDGNLISGNLYTGIDIGGSQNTCTGSGVYNGTSTGHIVRGNKIGTDVTGKLPVPNGMNGIGVGFDDFSSATIGGPGPGDSNVIAFNGLHGIGLLNAHTSILGNSIHSNGQLGIHFKSGCAPTSNDAGDPDAGPNNLQNYPEISSVSSAGGFTAQYVVPSTINSSAYPLRVEFFKADASQREGREYLGFDTYTTAQAGISKTATLTPAAALAAGDRIVATATDANGNTSEFSTSAALNMLSAAAACSTLVVNTNDSGEGSLREAINCANTSPGLDTISFNIPSSGVQTIRTLSLPTLTDSVIVDGYTQPGASQNTNAIDDPDSSKRGFNGTLLIELSGDFPAGNGLTVAANDSTIRGLAINNFAVGIELRGTGNVVEGNLIGTNAQGNAAKQNDLLGILAQGENHRIGGTSPATRNVISSNVSSGIVASGTNIAIQGNLVGTDASGTLGLGNGTGISLTGGGNNLVGGVVPGARNVVAANTGNGISVQSFSNFNTIQGNFVGLDLTGVNALGNSQTGIAVSSASNNLIGGATAAARNVISGSENASGVLLTSATLNTIQGNYIGTDHTGAQPLPNLKSGVEIVGSSSNNLVGGSVPASGNLIAFNGASGVYLSSGNRNSILSNAIFSNAAFGIDLSPDGVTPNDLGDPDAGANNLQNSPELDVALIDAAQFSVRYVVRSFSASAAFPLRVEFFKADLAGQEGQTLIGSDSYTATQAASFKSILLPSGPLTIGDRLVATATDANGNTSEFSASAVVTSSNGAVNDPPAGTDATVTINEDSVYTFSSLSFDFSDALDVPPHALSGVVVTSIPHNGTLRRGSVPMTSGQFISTADLADGLVTFTPAPNLNGASLTSMTFQVKDDGGTASGGSDLDPSPNSLVFNVISVNDAPSGTNKTITIFEDAPYPVKLADFGFNDAQDSPAHQLSAVRIATLPTRGTLRLNGSTVAAGQSVVVSEIAAGRLVYVPPLNGFGNALASFAFQVQDNGGTVAGGIDLDTSANTIGFNVTSVNDPPEGTDRTISFASGTNYVIGPGEFGFRDPADLPRNTHLAVKIVSLPGAGALVNNNEPVVAGQVIPVSELQFASLRYAPPENAVGNVASFTFQVQDDGGTESGGIDLDPTPNVIAFHVTSNNQPPSGADNTVVMAEGGRYTFAVGDFGFSDPLNNPPDNFKAVEITSTPGRGTLTLNNTPLLAGGTFVSVADIAAGRLQFVAGDDEVGLTQFLFRVQDDGLGPDTDPTANVFTFELRNVNDPPQAVDDLNFVREDGVVDETQSSVLVNDIDVDENDHLQVVAVNGVTKDFDQGVILPSGARVTMRADGTYLYEPLLAFRHLRHGQTDTDEFTYTARDQEGATSTARVTLVVSGVNSAPEGIDREVTLFEDSQYSFLISDFGFQDADVPPHNLSAVWIVGLPEQGALLLGSLPVGFGERIGVGDLAAGRLRFVPDANASGNPLTRLLFQVEDDGPQVDGGQNLDPSPNELAINVTQVNDPPAATNDVSLTFENVILDIPANGILENDRDLDAADVKRVISVMGEAANVGVEFQLSSGALLLVREDGSYRYDPNGMFESYASGQSTFDAFTYEMSDSEGETSSARAVIIIVGQNDAPLALDDHYVATEDTPLIVLWPGVIANDSDPEPELLTVAPSDEPDHGVLVLHMDGRFEYMPDPDFAGIDSFTYFLSDGQAQSGPATVTIEVRPTNDQPTVELNPVPGGDEGQLITISGSIEDPDEGDSWNVVLDFGDGQTSRLTGLSTRQFSLSHAYRDEGTYLVSVQVTDAQGTVGSSTTTVVVNNVSPSDLQLDAPASVARGQQVTLRGTLFDPGQADLLSGQIAWGDGSSEPVVFSRVGGQITFAANHVFETNGAFTIRVEVADGDSGFTSESLQIAVTAGQGAAVRDGVLEITGSGQADNVALTLSGSRVVVNGTYGSTKSNVSFPLSSFTRIVAVLGSGDDIFKVDSRIRKALLVDAGAGNDRITAGGGNSILVGGDGSDLLYGAGGRDVLIGGGGRDQLWGYGASDLLIAGRTNFDSNAAALRLIMAEWSASRSLAIRMNNLRTGSGPVLGGQGITLRPQETAFDDADVDLVMGGADNDWFVMQPGRDNSRDRASNEPLN